MGDSEESNEIMMDFFFSDMECLEDNEASFITRPDELAHKERPQDKFSRSLGECQCNGSRCTHPADCKRNPGSGRGLRVLHQKTKTKNT